MWLNSMAVLFPMPKLRDTIALEHEPGVPSKKYRKNDVPGIKETDKLEPGFATASHSEHRHTFLFAQNGDAKKGKGRHRWHLGTTPNHQNWKVVSANGVQ
jgi:hypothetical protein